MVTAIHLWQEDSWLRYCTPNSQHTYSSCCMYSDSKVKLTLGDSYLPWEFKLFGVEQIIESKWEISVQCHSWAQFVIFLNDVVNWNIITLKQRKPPREVQVLSCKFDGFQKDKLNVELLLQSSCHFHSCLSSVFWVVEVLNCTLWAWWEIFVQVINSQLVFKYDLKGDKNSSCLGPFFLSDPWQWKYALPSIALQA